MSIKARICRNQAYHLRPLVLIYDITYNDHSHGMAPATDAGKLLEVPTRLTQTLVVSLTE